MIMILLILITALRLQIIDFRKSPDETLTSELVVAVDKADDAHLDQGDRERLNGGEKEREN